MASLVSALKKHTPKQLGENGSVEHAWSFDIKEKIVQLFFQLVRTKDTDSLKNQLRQVLGYFKGKEYDNHEDLTLLYKMIGQTRDVVNGKGEWSLTYMLIYEWFQFYPELAKEALSLCVMPETAIVDMVEVEQHPYGSWKDIKYFCNYVKEQCGTEFHELILFATDLMVKQLNNDWEQYNVNGSQTGEHKSLSLAAKWCPRQGSKRFSWIYKRIAKQTFEHYIKTSKNNTSLKRATSKCYREMRQRLSKMNRYLDTTQIKMCEKTWRDIDFKNVTSLTMMKSNKAFNNKDKKGNVRHHSFDRIQCSNNLNEHIELAKEGKTNVKAKRCNVYELVKMVLEGNNDDLTNEMWKSNSTNNGGLGNVVSVVDTSGSMKVDECLPLYNAIGLGIRISEKASEPFKNMFITFHSTPEIVTLNPDLTFVQKVRQTARANWGGSTNFMATFNLLLEVAIDNEIPPSEMEDLVLAVFSDMQFDQAGNENYNTIIDTIKIKYATAGLNSKFGQPYKVPHILFWNLRKTEGFPCISTDRNVTMLSGYSSTLLNLFCEKGIEELKGCTPYKMLCELLNHERYLPMEKLAHDTFSLWSNIE